MIPQRIKLSGFLSYEGRAGHPVRRIAVVDALRHQRQRQVERVRRGHVRALFGHHRGGDPERRGTHQQEANTLAVEFDFTGEKQLYRIKRTVRRQKNDKIASTQQVLKFSHKRRSRVKRGKRFPARNTRRNSTPG